MTISAKQISRLALLGKNQDSCFSYNPIHSLLAKMYSLFFGKFQTKVWI